MRLAIIVLMMAALDNPLDNPVDLVVQSGQIVGITESPSERLRPPALIAPGVPPALGFRTIEGRLRHRFGDLDLVLDDAGH